MKFLIIRLLNKKNFKILYAHWLANVKRYFDNNFCCLRIFIWCRYNFIFISILHFLVIKTIIINEIFLYGVIFFIFFVIPDLNLFVSIFVSDRSLHNFAMILCQKKKKLCSDFNWICLTLSLMDSGIIS
jgi:hypothetical protein